MKAQISTSTDPLMTVKIIKETLGIGLKEAKDMYDKRIIEGEPNLVEATLDKLINLA